MLLPYFAILVAISSLVPIVRATICYDCPNPADPSTCSLIDSEAFGYLGCLIEFEDPLDTGLRIRRLSKFCPSNFTECLNLTVQKETWFTFVWKKHNPSTKELRKNPMVNIWYECFTDRCNDPEYIDSLMSVNVHWNTELFAKTSAEVVSSKQCYVCSNQTTPFVCTSTNRCENGCKMQGYRIDTNPVASRLLTLYHVRYWQPQCNDDLTDYQASNYSFNGYVINNLNAKRRNIAIEAYCSRDNCNHLDTISAFMNNISITFVSEPWFSSVERIKPSVKLTFLLFLYLLSVPLWTRLFYR